MRTANLALRFLLELCALAALGYWGAHAGGTGAIRIALALAAPLAAALVWGALVAPRAVIRAPNAVRLVAECVVFGAALAALAAAGRTRWAVILGLAILLNEILLTMWDQRWVVPDAPVVSVPDYPQRR
jgi:hypothetical protein